MDASPVQSMLADVSRLKNGVDDARLRMELARVEGLLYAAEMGDDIDPGDLDGALDEMLFAADSVSMDHDTKATINRVYANAPDAVMQLGDVTVEHSPGL